MYNPQLETFLTVAEAGGFNKAAEKLYISPGGHQADQPAGAGLGPAPLPAPHRGPQLTKRASPLYQDAKYIIQYCKDSVTRARNAMEEAGQVIRIGTSPMTPRPGAGGPVAPTPGGLPGHQVSARAL